MRVIDAAQTDARDMGSEGAQGVVMRLLIGAETGAPRFAMRLFEVAPGGYTPRHAHPWEHEVFVLQGEGEVASPQARLPLRAGTAALVAPGEEHQFVNRGAEPLRFLCVIPLLQETR